MAEPTSSGTSTAILERPNSRSTTSRRAEKTWSLTCRSLAESPWATRLPTPDHVDWECQRQASTLTRLPFTALRTTILRNSYDCCGDQKTTSLPEWPALSGAVRAHEVTIATFEFQKLVESGTVHLRNVFRFHWATVSAHRSVLLMCAGEIVEFRRSGD